MVVHMALAMARPWKHPKTGIYCLRKRVPDGLRPILGKREEKRSLGTRDSAEAMRLHAQALVELEQRWANLRAPPKPISEREAHVLVAPAMRRIDGLHTERPFLGSRRIAKMLGEEGLPINRKRVRRLMRLMGIEALGPKPRTSQPAP